MNVFGPQFHYFMPKHSKMNCARVLLCVLIIIVPSPTLADSAKEAYRSGDYATAFQEWTKAAEAGDADAQFNLGYMYENGQGVHQDLFAAIKWYELAARQNYPTSREMVDSVRRKIQDENEQNILKWLPKADAGDIRSQLALARLLSQNTDTKDNHIEALKWLFLAAQGTINKTVLARIRRSTTQLKKQLSEQDQKEAMTRLREWNALRQSNN